VTDYLPTGQARELLHRLDGQRVRNEHPDDDLPTPEPLPCGATAPLHSGGEAVCTRPAGHTTHIADNGARWTEDPYRTGLASELRRLAKTYGYPAVAHALTEQILHTQEQK